MKLLGFDERGKVRLSMKIIDQATGKELPRAEGEPEEQFSAKASAAPRARGWRRWPASPSRVVALAHSIQQEATGSHPVAPRLSGLVSSAR